jgi:hypothetical protein
MHATITCQDIEQELCSLVCHYEAQGFKHHFYLENGSLVCSKYDLVLTEADIHVHETRYCPKRSGMPHGFCLFAVTVSKTPCVLKGLFLLPQGLLTQQQLAPGLVRQLGLRELPAEIFKTETTSREKFFPFRPYGR